MLRKYLLSKRLVAFGLSAAASISGGFLIASYEGNPVDRTGLSSVYLDPIGIPTACYGQTGRDLYGRKIQLGMTYTQDECLRMLASTVKSFEEAVDRRVKVGYASPWQKAALISFTYNVGEGSLQSSTLLRKLNSGEHEEACKELTRWVYANKKVLPGLVHRRGEEMRWCMGDVPEDVQLSYEDIVEQVVPLYVEKTTARG